MQTRDRKEETEEILLYPEYFPNFQHFFKSWDYYLARYRASGTFCKQDCCSFSSYSLIRFEVFICILSTFPAPFLAGGTGEDAELLSPKPFPKLISFILVQNCFILALSIIIVSHHKGCECV